MAVMIIKGDHLVHLFENIPDHSGVSVFIDGDGCRGMRNKEDTEPLFDIALPDNFLYRVRDIDKLCLVF